MAKRQVGKVTGTTSAAAAIGAATAQIVVELTSVPGTLEGPITVLLTAGFALIGGYLVKPENRDYLDDILGDLDDLDDVEDDLEDDDELDKLDDLDDELMAGEPAIFEESDAIAGDDSVKADLARGKHAVLEGEEVTA